MDTIRDEVKIAEIIKHLLRHISLILLTSIAGALVMYLIANVVVPTQYVSDITIGVYTKPGQQISPAATLQADTYLVQDYAAVIKSRNVAKRVIEDLLLLHNGEPMDPGTLMSHVVVNPGDGTSRMITISIVYDDPFLAADIAEKYGEVSLNLIKDMYGGDNIQIIDEANVPLQKYSPNTTKFILLGFSLGAIAGAVVLISLYLIENKVRFKT